MISDQLTRQPDGQGRQVPALWAPPETAEPSRGVQVARWTACSGLNGCAPAFPALDSGGLGGATPEAPDIASRSARTLRSLRADGGWLAREAGQRGRFIAHPQQRHSPRPSCAAAMPAEPTEGGIASATPPTATACLGLALAALSLRRVPQPSLHQGMAFSVPSHGDGAWTVSRIPAANRAQRVASAAPTRSDPALRRFPPRRRCRQ